MQVAMQNSVGSALTSLPGPTDPALYGRLAWDGARQAVLQALPFPSQTSQQHEFLCQLDRNWVCPPGYTPFLETCYRYIEVLVHNQHF